MNKSDINSGAQSAQNLAMLSALQNAKTLECECGGMIFQPALVIKVISPILSPTGKEEHYPIEVMVCKKCGKIPAEFSDPNNIIPKELIRNKIKL